MEIGKKRIDKDIQIWDKRDPIFLFHNSIFIRNGARHLLKHILKEFSAYNFDFILDKEVRLKSIDDGGTKEYYDAALAIGQHSRKQLAELQAKGLELYKTNRRNYLVTDNNNESQIEVYDGKTKVIFQKLSAISAILEPQAYDPQSFKRMLMDMDSSIDEREAEDFSRLYGLDVTEAKFAYDLTSLYFLSLHNNQGFAFAGPANYYSRREQEAIKRKMKRISASTDSKEADHQKFDGNNYSSIAELLPVSPDERLISILENDQEIREWFSKWIEDLMSYQKETLEEMSNFYNKIKTKSEL